MKPANDPLRLIDQRKEVVALCNGQNPTSELAFLALLAPLVIDAANWAIDAVANWGVGAIDSGLQAEIEKYGAVHKVSTKSFSPDYSSGRLAAMILAA